MNRLVSEEERTLSQDIDFTIILSYEDRQKLYERRLKLTKALPVIQQEMCQLEDENEDKISLYITQKGEFTTGLRMLIDQIDRILRKDNEWRQEVGLQMLRTLKFYPSGVDLWAEMPVDVIRKAAEEHEVKHIGMGKTSKRIDKIPSITSAFQRVPPSTSEKGMPRSNSDGSEVSEPKRSEQTQGAVVQQSVSSSMSAMTSVTNETQTEGNLIEERQQKRQKVLEQFLREAKR